MTQRSRLRAGLVAATALVALSVAVVLRFAGRPRLRFTYLTGALGVSAYQALAAVPGWSTAQLEVAPGVTLRGLVRKPQADDAPWLLFYPGNDATQLRTGQAFLSRLAQQRDWGLAVFAYRGYDGSDGAPHHESLAQDAGAIWRGFSASYGVSPGRLHLVGFSIGGHFSVHGALAAAQAGKPARSLSLLAPVDDIAMLRRSSWQRFLPGDDYQTRPLLAAVPAPVLIVQGAADQALGGAVQAKAIAQSLGERAHYFELPGVGHQELLEAEPMFEKLRAFIGEHSQ